MFQKNWQELIKATDLNVEHDPYNPNIATIIVEPMERGYGLTIGNALRRVMLSSLQGAAVVGVKFDGGLHEFSSLNGVREDVTDIILNIKNLALKAHKEGPLKMSLKVEGPGEVTAKKIQTDSNLEVTNPELVLCHLSDNTSLSIEMLVETGKGYVPVADFQDRKNYEVGLIPVDAIFSPVKKVSYRVEATRVGKVTDYDRLMLTVATDGSVSPEDAVSYAARILQDQLSSFINFEYVEEPVEKEKEQIPFNPNLLRKVEELDLSVRSANCLRSDNVVYIGELVQKTESDILKTPNFGRKSLNEIKAVLSSMGLSFGMNVPEWPPENIKEMAKKFEEGL